MREERPFDVDAFSDAFKSAFESLESQDQINENDPQIATYRTRFKELDRLRKQLSTRLNADKGDMLSKLSRMSRGRRGLDGYRAALEGDKRGIPRGRG